MDVINRINQLMEERSWTPYRLSLESGLSSSTIANIYRRNTVPSLVTLEAICKAFGISMSQFFAEDSRMVELNDEQLEFFNNWVSLTKHQKDLIDALIKEMK